MNSTLKTLVGAIVAIWAVLLAGLVILAPSTPAESRFASGGLEKAVAEIGGTGLTTTAIMPADVYGDEFVGGAFLCPGMTEEDITQFYGVDASALELDGPIPADMNYVMLFRPDLSTEFDAIERDAVDLCNVQTVPFDANLLVPLNKTEQGGWQLWV